MLAVGKLDNLPGRIALQQHAAGPQSREFLLQIGIDLPLDAVSPLLDKLRESGAAHFRSGDLKQRRQHVQKDDFGLKSFREGKGIAGGVTGASGEVDRQQDLRNL